jgi:hypothetical protein
MLPTCVLAHELSPEEMCVIVLALIDVGDHPLDLVAVIVQRFSLGAPDIVSILDIRPLIDG